MAEDKAPHSGADVSNTEPNPYGPTGINPAGIPPPPPPRRSSRAVWAMAVVVVALLAAVGAVAWFIIDAESSDTDVATDEPAAVTVSITPTTTTEEPAPPAAEVAPPAAVPTTTVQPVQPPASVPVEGGSCLESEARSFGTSADGQNLVCIYMGGAGRYAWVRHGENSGQVHNIGEPCDPAVDQVAVDPDGKAIMCGGQYWTTGP